VLLLDLWPGLTPDVIDRMTVATFDRWCYYADQRRAEIERRNQEMGGR
jgi:hypothetical protein